MARLHPRRRGLLLPAMALLCALGTAPGGASAEGRRLDFSWDVTSLSYLGYAGAADVSGAWASGSRTTAGLGLAAASPSSGAIQASARASLEIGVATGAQAALLWPAAALGETAPQSAGGLLLVPAYGADAQVPEALVTLGLRTAWAKLATGPVSLSLGRLLLGSGRGALWSPEDFLTGLEASGLSVRKKSVDALRLSAALGDTGLADLVARPGGDPSRGDYSLRVRGLPLEGLDLGALAARRAGAGAWLLGGDLKADLGPSVYAEATATLPDSGAAPTWRAAAGLDWSLPGADGSSGGLVVALEYYYNGGLAAADDPYGAEVHNLYASLAWRAGDYLSFSTFGTWAPGAGTGGLTLLGSLDAAQGTTFSVYLAARKAGTADSPTYAGSAGLLVALRF